MSPRATRGATARRPVTDGASGLRVADLGLGWRSHVLACRFDGEIAEHEDHVVVRTPSNPTYYWGNCLILRDPPRDADLPHWLERFDQAIASRQPASRHLAFGIDAAALPDRLPSWRAAGIVEFDDMAVLALRPAGLAPAPAVRDVPGLEWRRLDLNTDDLRRAIEAQVAGRDPSFDAEGYRVFRDAAMRRMQAMQAAGCGAWFGAFVGQELVADCGLVHEGRGGMGRFQNVQTQVAWRRRGLCRALVHRVCQHAFGAIGVRELVMCADPHDVAIGIYRSLGFARIETHWCLQRRAPQAAA